MFGLLYLILSKTFVYVHLENLNKFMVHTGISFKQNYKTIRYDFRISNQNNDYLTTEKSRLDFNLMFPDLEKLSTVDSNLILDFIEHRKKIEEESLTLLMGISDLNLEEIIEYEKIISKKYIFGFYDCRHYTNKLLLKTLNKKLPIWDLNNFKKMQIKKL